MASYTDLYNLNNNSELKNRVMVSCLVAAENIMGESGSTVNHANRLVWSAKVFESPLTESDRMFWAIIAANNTLSIPQITGATDVQIQSAVDGHVDLFATG